MTGGPERLMQRLLGLGAALIVFLVDQSIKFAVTERLNLDELGTDSIRLAPFFNLTFTQNRGVSMGFLSAETELMRWLLVGMLLVVCALVVWWLWREKAREDIFALGLVLGGAIGNITDRVRLGYVIDYADFHIGAWRPFLIFNLADAAISIGVFILLARALLLREKARRPKESSQDA
jgi:signal peptidase II